MTDNVSTLPQTLTKKEARKLIFQKLAGALEEFKTGVKEKKFVNNLKKASRLFAADIATTIGKKKEKAPKQAKKKMKVVNTEAKTKVAS